MYILTAQMATRSLVQLVPNQEYMQWYKIGESAANKGQIHLRYKLVVVRN